MARDIDRIIKYVQEDPYLSPVEKLVIEARLEHAPTPNELLAAREELRTREEKVEP